PVSKLIAGNVVALSGIRGAVAGATVSSNERIVPFKSLSYAVEPVVTIALEAKNPADLPKLVEGMRLIELVDPSLRTKINEETGEYLLSGTGELHLEIAVKDLQEMQKLEVTQSEPIIVFRESVGAISPEVVLAKSPNKHNRIFLTAQPLEEQIVDAIETKVITPYTDPKKMAAILRDLGWEKDIAKSVWAFGPGEDGPNVLVDATKGVQYLRDVKEYINQGIRWGMGEGPLCGEPLFGVRLNLVDCSLHEDSVHRGIAQVMPASRQATFGAVRVSTPVLLEPIYKLQVNVPERHLGAVYKVISKRRGKILDTVQKEGTPTNIVSGEVPVSESIGITTELRSETSGFAFSQLIFDHWEKVPGDPMKPEASGGGLARKFVEMTRKRKGFHSISPPAPSEYVDRL
ncbi:MAG TPA: hypothetical protein VJ044_18925, partial [Candidatus Hodarchaeales archaeon]|nr:hypothetical protein [Candidatus Hodarchaeales archaeon]